MLSKTGSVFKKLYLATDIQTFSKKPHFLGSGDSKMDIFNENRKSIVVRSVLLTVYCSKCDKVKTAVLRIRVKVKQATADSALRCLLDCGSRSSDVEAYSRRVSLDSRQESLPTTSTTAHGRCNNTDRENAVCLLTISSTETADHNFKTLTATD